MRKLLHDLNLEKCSRYLPGYPCAFSKSISHNILRILLVLGSETWARAKAFIRISAYFLTGVYAVIRDPLTITDKIGNLRFPAGEHKRTMPTVRNGTDCWLKHGEQKR